MEHNSVIEQMRQLIQLIAKHNHAYYVMDEPSISDSEYDHLFHQLKALEQQYPDLIQTDTPTNKVGGQALSKFESVTHTVPMLSLNNVFEEDELLAFANRVEERLPNQKVQYDVELKFDGLAISLWYENGVLVAGDFSAAGGIPAENFAVYQYPDIPVKDYDATHILIYPNPAHDRVFVELQSGALADIIVSDMRGNIIYTKPACNSVTINMSGFAAGWYVIKVKNAENVFSSLIFVE